MSSPANTEPTGAPAGLPPPVRELTPRGRTIGVVIWCSFLAAAGGTTLTFALFDPGAIQGGELPSWWIDRRTVYALGFFCLWLVAAISAALTIYMAHTDTSARSGGKP
ncbi:MAG: hypothetical protein ABI885_00090 [Gammaproteobacteria bacterium]